ncbi:MAG TPA: hypothetical protein PLG31_19455 [Spirochaetota bacterium]|nr:hypothetical protein [Spirochaetota bacterium]
MLNHAIVKLAALGSSLGGPLFVFDLARPRLGTMPAFLLIFSPIALMMLAALALDEESTDPLARASMYGGIMGSVVLFAMNEFAFWRLYQGAQHPNHGMIVAGIAIGVVASALVAYRSVCFLRS